jgi:hypothetical protein
MNDFEDNNEDFCIDEDIDLSKVKELQAYIDEINAIEDDSERKIAAAMLHAALGGEDGQYMAFRPS